MRINELRYRIFAGLFGALLLIVGCERIDGRLQGPQYSTEADHGSIPVYRLAVHPLYNPQKLVEAYQPLIDFLNQQVSSVRFEIEASRNYQAYEAKFRAREPELLLPNPWHTLQALKHGYRVLAMAGEPEDFRGVLIVRKDGPINAMSDLKGKVMSCPSSTALAACMLPQRYLHDQGIDINQDIKTIFVGSQESSIMNVYLAQVDIGASWPPPWRAFVKEHPREAAELKIMWETPYLPNNSVMVRDDIPTVLRDQVKKVLLDLDKSAQGRAILARMETDSFRDADETSYESVRDFIQVFEQEVRPVEQK